MEARQIGPCTSDRTDVAEVSPGELPWKAAGVRTSLGTPLARPERDHAVDKGILGPREGVIVMGEVLACG